MAKSTIPVGSKVRVLDTRNVRAYNKDAVGYEFITTADSYGDLEVIETSVVNNYQIY